MSLEGIREFIKSAIPQIAAMDGENDRLGDSDREVSIMNRLLANATPEEKDFVQKLLDGEKIANPQEQNSDAVIKFSADGIKNGYFKEYLEDASYYESQYDDNGTPIEGKAVFYNKTGDVIATMTGNGSNDMHFERADGSYSFHQVVKGDDFYRIEKTAWQKDEAQNFKQYTCATSKYNFTAEEDHVLVVNSEGTKCVDYEISNGIVKLPQKALKNYPNIDIMLKECGYEVEIQ